jgi:hypothetical protein
MLRAGATLKRWRVNIGNKPGTLLRIVSYVQTPVFQSKFNKKEWYLL